MNKCNKKKSFYFILYIFFYHLELKQDFCEVALVIKQKWSNQK